MLLKLNFSTSLFEVLLEILGSGFVKTFLEYAGSTVNHFLSFLQAKTGKFLNELNNLEFSSTGRFQNHVERGLLFSGGSTSSGAGSNCNCSSGGFDAIFFFEDLSEFVYFFYREVNELFCESFQICHCSMIFLFVSVDNLLLVFFFGEGFEDAVKLGTT